MKQFLHFGLILIFALSLAACASQITPEELDAADPGPYPDNYQTIVTNGMTKYLFDPYSAQYQFIGEPVKSGVRKPPLLGGGVVFGWGGQVLINSKNRMGGYVGFKPYYYIIRDGRLENMTDMQTGRGL